VVVHQVTTWKIKEFHTRGHVELLPEDWDPESGDDPFGGFEQGHDLELLFAGMPARVRDVLRLRYLTGLEIEEIAERLGLTRNAVDQPSTAATRRSGSRLADDVITLFDEYAVRFARGETPDAREYLERAGSDREALAELIDRYLAEAPPREPDEDLIAAFAAWAGGEPPLLELRVRRGVRRDTIVEAIVIRFGLAADKRAKVGRYVHRLETGLLDPRGVDRGVLEAWADALRARVEDLLAWRPVVAAEAQSLSADAYLRATDALYQLDLPPPAPVDERDEVDELFTRPE
jgi:DNA-directed RNA polymerase specialized sigma24 family protein